MIEKGSLVGDRYRLEAEIGRGAMGSVWSATHTLSGKRVAVKLLRRPEREDLVRRFLLEARAACAVSHPSIVAVHDVFLLDDGTPAMTMDLLAGETLAAHLARCGPLDAERAAQIFLPLVSGVGALHAAGIVHRDLKPDNVFVVDGATGAQRIRVLDLGVAKLFGADAGATETGATLGTPAYMAPEQAMGAHDIDLRADVWAIGAMLYEALSGARPVDGENQGQVVRALLTGAITPLEVITVDVPDALTAMVAAMLQKDRVERPADLRAVAETLTAYAPGLVVPAVAPPGTTSLGGIETRQSVTRRGPVPRRRSALVGTLGVVALSLVAWATARQVSRSAATDAAASGIPDATAAPVVASVSATASPSVSPPFVSAQRVPSAAAEGVVTAPLRLPPRSPVAARSSPVLAQSASVDAPLPPPRASSAGLIEVPPF